MSIPLTKIVMLLHQAVEHQLLRGAPHLLDSGGWRLRNWLSMGVVSINTGSGRAQCASGLCHT